MTIKFRIINVGSLFCVQTKKWYGWKYKTEIKDITMWEYRSFYETESDCINRILNDCKIKKEALRLIKYPSLTIL